MIQACNYFPTSHSWVPTLYVSYIICNSTAQLHTVAVELHAAC